jgi:hypothetical protein
VRWSESTNSTSYWRYNRPMLTLRVLLTTLLLAGLTAEERVSFPTQDGGVVYADVYGEGPRGVVLAHGGRFNKESWKKSAGAGACRISLR